MTRQQIHGIAYDIWRKAKVVVLRISGCKAHRRISWVSYEDGRGTRERTLLTRQMALVIFPELVGDHVRFVTPHAR